MNGFSTLALRATLGLLVLVAFLAAPARIQAQCGLNFASPTVNYQITLDGFGSGSFATLDAFNLGITPSGPGCGLEFDDNFAFSSPSAAESFSCADLGATTVYVRANTSVGGPDPSVAFVTVLLLVVELQPPTITCPASLTLNTNAGLCTRVVTGIAASTSDNCNVIDVWYSASGVTSASSPLTGINDISGTTFNLGVTNVAYQCADESGNLSTVCNFSVTIEDNQNPSMTCPANMTLNMDPGVCYATFAANAVALAPVAYSDNCSGVTFDYRFRQAFGAFGPILAGPIPGATQFLPGTPPPANAVNRVGYRAHDAANNVSAFCFFNVSVVDNQFPTASGAFPLSHNLSTSTGASVSDCIGRENIAFPAVTDNCAISSYTCEYSGATVAGPFAVAFAGGTLLAQDFNLGATTVTFEFKDNATPTPHTVTYTYTITVVDDTPPTDPGYTGMTMATVDPGDCSKTVTWTRPTLGAAVDCSGFTVSQGIPTLNGNPNPGLMSGNPPYVSGAGDMVTTSFPVGTNVIPFIWTDGNGNTTTNSFTVIIKETEAPVAKCKSYVNLTLSNTPGGLGFVNAQTSDVDDFSTDNCGIASYVLSQTLFTCADVVTPPADITLTVTDNAGNTASCSAPVFIIDNDPPVLTCPGNVFVDADANCMATGLDAFPSGLPLVAVENCYPDFANAVYSVDGAVTFQFVNPDFPNQIFPLGSTTVYLLIADETYINQGVCSFSITVQDNTAPVPSATLAALTLVGPNNVNLGGCQGTATWNDGGAPLFTDNCTAPGSLVITKSHTSGGIFPLGNTVVTYTATDAAGNVGMHTFTVQMVDNQAPLAKCKPNFTLNLPSGPSPSVSIALGQIDNGTTDNCFLTTLAHAPTVLNCANLGNTNIVLTASDGTNTSTCQTTVTLNDVTAPTAVCQTATVTLNAGGSATLNVSAITHVSSTDNCPPPAFLASKSAAGPFTGPTLPFACADLPSKTVWLQATDGSGNTATCSTTVTVIDNTAPSFVGGSLPAASVALECSDPIPAPATVTATDVCTSPVTVNFSTLSTQGLSGCTKYNYTITRTWTAVDGSGNTVSFVQTITVSDTKAPTTTLANVTVDLTSNNCTLAVPSIAPTALNVSDNCSPFANITVLMGIDYPSGTDIPNSTPYAAANLNNFPIGTSTVTFTFSDICGNQTVKNITVTVLDKAGPVFSLFPFPPPIGTLCGQNFVLTNTPNNCSNLFSWHRPNSNALFNQPFPVGDGSADLTDCSGGITVSESITNAGNAAIASAVAASLPAFNYNANPLIQPTSVNPTGQFPVSAQPTVFTYTATDAAGNTSTCSFSVKVNDAQNPTIVCPSLQILATTCPTGQVPDYTNLAIVSDNCPSNLTLGQQPGSGTQLSAIAGLNLVPGAMFTVTLSVTDLGPNSNTCTFKVALADGDDPIPDVVPLPDVVSDCGHLELYAPTASDPCNTATPIIYGTPSASVGMLISSNPPQYAFIPGNYVITWIYNDGHGNLSSQVQNITVHVDTYPPTALCQSGLAVNLDATGKATIDASQLDAGSYDQTFCDVTLGFAISSNNNLTCANLGNAVTMTLTVSDSKNNTATCTTSVSCYDVTPPDFAGSLPQNTTIECGTAIPAPATVTATDVCDPSVEVALTTQSTQTPTGCGHYTYTITRTWVASDDSGNQSTHTQTIEVHDTQAPSFGAAPNNLVVLTSPSQLLCQEQVNLNLTPFITDCEAAADVNITPSGGNLSGIYAVGVYNFTVTLTDVCGNTTNRVEHFEVKDATVPTAVCFNGISTTINQAGVANITTGMINNNSSDNCGTITLAISPSQFTCADADGTTQHVVTLTVTDASGNSAACISHVVVNDLVAPMLNFCPSDQTVLCSANYTVQALGAAIFSDNCNATLQVAFLESHITFGTGSGTFTRTWTATDAAHNSAVCTQTITLTDNEAPTLSQMPIDLTVSCPDEVPPTPTVTASDNCDQSVAVTVTDNTTVLGTGACADFHYAIDRTFQAKDDYGNEVVHTQTITVKDDVAPEFVGLPDTLTFYSANGPANGGCTAPVNLDIFQYLTDCAADIDLTVSVTGAPIGGGSASISGTWAVGEYSLHFKATDPCGNLSEVDLLVEIVDNSVPTAICHTGVTVALGSQGSASLDPLDIDAGSTDNCGIFSLELSQADFTCADLGLHVISLIATDDAGNSNACTATVEVTPGTSNTFLATANDGNTTHFGAADGTVSVTVTGGSGNFIYLWSTGATTPSITDLFAGSYDVTVTDTQSGCVQVVTAFVNDGPNVEFVVADILGKQGDMVNIPVSVNNFNDIETFQFSIHVVDANVATVLNILADQTAIDLPGMDFQFQINGNDISIIWTAPAGQSLTLPDGFIIFEIKTMLNGALGSSSPVLINGDPVLVEVNQDINGSPVSVPVEWVDGSITVTQSLNTVELAGNIETWFSHLAVPNVDVSLAAPAPQQTLTGLVGDYTFTVPTGDTTLTTCSKNTPGNAGITVGDLVKIVNHIFNDPPFNSPYQWVAADVNNSGTVTLADYIRIQRVALGTDLHLQGSPDWKFIRSDYSFPNPPIGPGQPLLQSAQEYDHTPALQDWLADDFVAVRMGDVNGSAPVNFKPEGDDRNGGVLHLDLDDRAFAAGETVEVPFRATPELAGRQGLQFTVAFDAQAFDLQDIVPGLLPNLSLENFGTARLSDGYLSFVWASREAAKLAEGQALFTLKLRAKTGGESLEKSLRPSSDITRNEALSADGLTTDRVDFNYIKLRTGQTVAQPILYQNRPNPFAENTVVAFRLPEAGAAKIRIYNVQGQLVKMVVGNFEQGLNEVVVRKSELGSAGGYFYELETSSFTERKKMTLLD